MQQSKPSTNSTTTDNMAPAATAAATVAATVPSSGLWLHGLEERDDPSVGGLPLAPSPRNLYGVVGGQRGDHGEFQHHQTGSSPSSNRGGGGLYGLSNASPNRTIWSDHQREVPYQSRMNFAVADDTSSTASVADSAFFGSIGETQQYYGTSSGPTTNTLSMDPLHISSSNRNTSTIGGNLPPAQQQQRSFQTSSLALAAATAAAVASNRSMQLPTPTSISSSGTSIPSLVGASSGSTAPSSKDGSPNPPKVMSVGRVSGPGGSSMWPRIAYGQTSATAMLAASTPSQQPRGTSSLALAAAAGTNTLGAGGAALPSPPPGFLSQGQGGEGADTQDDSYNSSGKNSRRRTRGGRRNRTRRQNRESRSSDQMSFPDSSSASYNNYDEEEVRSGGGSKLSGCSALPGYGSSGANTATAAISLAARTHHHMMNAPSSPTTLDTDSRASSEAIRALMKPQTSGSLSQASTMQSSFLDFDTLGDADYSNHTATTAASSSNNLQQDGLQRPILPQQRQQQQNLQQQSMLLLDDQLFFGTQFDDDDDEEDDSSSWDGSHPSGLFGTGSASSNAGASRHMDSMASSSGAGTNSSPRTKKRDWLLRMNRKLQEIPLGELDPAQVPLAAIMNAWAKTKSSQGAAMVELWLKRAQQEYDAGNRRVVPTTKMYTMAGTYASFRCGLMLGLMASAKFFSITLYSGCLGQER